MTLSPLVMDRNWIVLTFGIKKISDISDIIEKSSLHNLFQSAAGLSLCVCGIITRGSVFPAATFERCTRILGGFNPTEIINKSQCIQWLEEFITNKSPNPPSLRQKSVQHVWNQTHKPPKHSFSASL